MSISLVDALEDVELEAGQTYRCEVRGHQVELHVLAAPTVNRRNDSTALSDDDVMLDAWCELPRPPVIRRVIAKRVDQLPFDIPHIPPEEGSDE
jgi:hypothetical protein